ncbi:tyrosine-type recombinase/integrase [Hirschia litorea]|uniref:Tyrosine-type recombinase/integrase n=1 Tax=Hirschia litorea TaxID=1199156 RepID=A0ABW2IHH6_9PROT
MSLSDFKIRSFKPEQRVFRHSDGGGLYIEVKPSGSKLWKMAYRFHGKQRTLSFGAYPYTSLAIARSKRDEAKTLIANGVDPQEKSKQEKAEQAALHEHTFRNIAAELLNKNIKEGKSEATIKKKKWLIDMLNKDFGDVPITQLKPIQILTTLRKSEAKEHYETAKRLRMVVGEVCCYAIATARLEMDPTYGLKGALITAKVIHRAAIIDKQEFAGLVNSVWQYEGGGPIVQAGLKLMVLLYPRPGELRLSHWTEFDFEKAIWSIPADRMKMRRPHVKPLSKPVLSILQEIKEFTGGDGHVLQSLYARGRPISENTMNQALRRMGYSKDEMTAHGFRSSASSILNESGLWNPDAIEAELAHADTNKVRSAYHRAQYWDERVKMANSWTDEVIGMLN